MFAAKNFVTRYVLKAGAVAMFGCLTLGLAGTFVPSARAATIDTFDFTQTGWASPGGTVVVNGSNIYVVGSPDPGSMLSGSFAGTVEPDAYIELNDLTAFSATYTDDANPTGIPSNSNFLTLFSFNTAGGSSSLDFADTGLSPAPTACTGAAASLDPNCTSSFAFNPAGTNGVFMFLGGVPQGPGTRGLVFTASLPSVSLVGSVTTPPPTAAPEPASLLLFGSGLLGMALLIRRRSAKATL